MGSQIPYLKERFLQMMGFDLAGFLTSFPGLERGSRLEMFRPLGQNVVTLALFLRAVGLVRGSQHLDRREPSQPGDNF